jgi:hypothetical protein
MYICACWTSSQHLVGGIVDKNVNPAEFVDCLIDHLPAQVPDLASLAPIHPQQDLSLLLTCEHHHNAGAKAHSRTHTRTHTHARAHAQTRTHTNIQWAYNTELYCTARAWARP